MHLDCPECNVHFEPDDINITQVIAICKSCDNIFDFKEQFPLPAELPVVYKPPHRLKGVIHTTPEDIDIVKLGHLLEIKAPWRTGCFMFLLFGILWSSIVALSMTMFFVEGTYQQADQLPAALILFPLFTLIGGVFLYFGIMGYINKTLITVDDRYISIEFKPMNFLLRKGVRIDRYEVEQVYVKESDGSFSVEMALKGGKRIPLVVTSKSLETARFIEQEIEYHLNIEDRLVKGEWTEDIPKE